MFPGAQRTRPLFAFMAIAAAILATPLIWRFALWRWGPPTTSLPPSYLPALDSARERRAFDPAPIGDLQGMKPAYVIIGDSMAGRIDWDRLTQLTDAPIAPMVQNATGSAYWYLEFKNYIVRSGITPKWVIVFFRDTNLTDPMFRIGEPTHTGLDEVALDREDELNAVVAARIEGPWFRAHRLIDQTYAVERTRAWLEPEIGAWSAARVVASNRRRPKFLEDVNAMFSLEHLRSMTAADVEATEDRDTDFAANVKPSVLPLFLQLAHDHGLHLCFVRVLRRPQNGQPPPESARLTRYVHDLRGYLQSNGAVFRDDRDDPEMASIVYADGDHIDRGERRHYTESFFAKTPIFK